MENACAVLFIFDILEKPNLILNEIYIIVSFPVLLIQFDKLAS